MNIMDTGNTETPVAAGIRAGEGNAQYDAACKRVLAVRIVLAWIMKSCLEEYRDCDVHEIAENYIDGEPVISKVAVMPDETNRKIHGIGTEDTTLTEGTVTYDIRFLAVAPKSGELIRLIINIEPQGDFYPGYPVIKRAVYYVCRLVSSQHGTEFTSSNYQDIKKVYSIWIALKPPKERENTITRYRIVEENMVGSVKETVQDYDLITVLMLCLGKPEDTKCDILKLLDVLLSNEIGVSEKQRVLEDDFGIPMTEEIKGGFHDMSGLGDMIERKGIEKGRAEGIVRGIIASIKNLMKNTGWPIEQAMSTLGVPEEEWGKYTQLLTNQ